MLQGSNNLFRCETLEDINDFVQRIISENPDFKLLFEEGIDIIHEDEIENLKRKFSELYPQENLIDIINKYKIQATPIVPKPCNVNIYDPQKGKFYNPNITTSTKKTKSDFNLADFLINEQEEQKCVNLNFDTDQDDYFDLQDVPYDEKKKSNIATENSLIQIAKLALILNNTKEIPFTMLAVRGEEPIL